MSKGTRIALLAVAVLVLVGGIVLASSSGGSDDDPGGSTQASQTQNAPAETTPGATETGPAEPPPPRVESVRIRDGQPAGDAETLKFEKGDTIRLRFSSNAASEIHIHGYDKYVNVPAGGSARARFEATIDGGFEIEEHGTGALLAKLEVRP